MANIRVKTNNNTTTVRVGQTNAIRVVASNQATTTGTVISPIGTMRSKLRPPVGST